MTSPSTVRLAKPEDEEALMELCRINHAENGIFPLDEGLVRDTLHRAFNKQGAVWGVIGDSKLIEGAIYLSIDRAWYTRHPHLGEVSNFVHPDHRKSDHAKAMIEFAKACATPTAPLMIGVLSNERTEAKVRLYERRLGKPIGAFFIYPPRDPAENTTEH
jgi:GNAT superfamily N-acetyltransferase